MHLSSILTISRQRKQSALDHGFVEFQFGVSVGVNVLLHRVHPQQPEHFHRPDNTATKKLRIRQVVI